MNVREWSFTLWAHDTPMVKHARTAVRNGFAVVFLRPGGKEPLCPLTARERKKAGPNHPCGVSHASRDERWVVRVGQRLEKEYGHINLGIAAHASGVVVIDADGPEQSETVAELLRQLGEDAAVLAEMPTVQTPGKLRGTEWVHERGTHWYFNRPDELDLPLYPGELVLPGGAVMRWGNSYTLVPPSERAEGRYISLAEYIADVPVGLVAMVRAHVETKTQRMVDLGERFANNTIVRWSLDHPWHDLLEPDGWHFTGKLDHQCGCPVWRRPGDGASTDRSAIAHEDDCTRLPNYEGHGALYIFSDNPPGLLAERVAGGQRTFTKLQYITWARYGGNETAAKIGEGIEPDYGSMWDLAGDDQGDQGATREPAGDSQSTRSEGPWSPGDSQAPRDSQDEPGAGIWERNARRRLEALAIPITPALLEERVKSARQLGGRMEDIEIYKDVKAELTLGIFTARTQDDVVDEWVRAEVDSEPTHMARSDGKRLVTKARTNMILGRRGCGKTWQALHLSLEALDAEESVGYVDLEDTAGNMRGRFAVMGRNVDDLVRAEKFRRMGSKDIPPDLRSPLALGELVSRLEPYDVAIFDVLSRLVVRMGGDLNNCNTEVAMLYEYLFDPLAFGMGKLVVFLAHPNAAGQRSDANARFIDPAGGAITMNSLSGMGMSLDTVRPFTKENPAGEVRLWCRKDRSGYGEGDLLGMFRGALDMGADLGNLAMVTTIDAPDGLTNEERHAEAVEKVMKRVIEILDTRAEGVGPMNRSDIRVAMSKNQREHAEEAIALLLHQGRVIETSAGKIDLPPKEGA